MRQFFIFFALAFVAPIAPFVVGEALSQPVVREKKPEGHLTLTARLMLGGESIHDGLFWYVYNATLGENDRLLLVASQAGGEGVFDLDSGSYVVAVSFGHARAMRRVEIKDGQSLHEDFNLNAGAINLDAVLANGHINEKQLSFSLYKDDRANDETGLIMDNIKPRSLVRLAAGTYHVVSYYGASNAIASSNIQVSAGKIAQMTLQHQAAQITLKLVRRAGGEAIADTSWSIADSYGDIIYETAGAYASLILAEGDYVVTARNKDLIYQKEFSVSSGQDKNVDVISDPENGDLLDDSVD